MAEISRGEHVKRYLIGYVIGAMFVGVALWSLNKWHEDIIGGIAMAWNWTFATIETTRFTWWFFCLWFLFSWYMILHLAWCARRRREPYCDYTHDNFFGVHWKWGWEKNLPKSIHPYCPGCDRVMYWQDQPEERTVIFYCNECPLELPRQGSFRFNVVGVAREIELKVRKGTWENHDNPCNSCGEGREVA